jgi:hypothetical protein
MTKAENRAAARAYRQQKLQEMAQSIRADRVRADLAALDELRQYLIFKCQTAGPRDRLIAAIDDYVEAVTGDRTALHARSSSAG